MERLTEKHYGANDYYMTCSEECAKDIDCIDCPSFDSLVDRLGAYENTGLTPEEVNDAVVGSKLLAKSKLASAFGVAAERLRELAEADKEGRAVVLPCKVGDTMIYQTFEENPALMKNIRLEIAYESRCGVIFHMGYGIFADLVAHGRIKPGSGRNAEEG